MSRNFSKRQLIFLPLTKWLRLMFSAGPMLPSLHMPAEITARSKVDISRVARLFRAQFCRSAVADNTLTIKQKSTLPVSKTRQDKSLFCPLSGTCLPSLESGLCVTSALPQPRHHGLPPHLRHYYPPPASACARRPFCMTTCAAATAAPLVRVRSHEKPDPRP